ncbi:hypothetical protein J6590_058129 [Homalodisca vitripennis]|nr:hypothetical protein J6590_058129 [Homalodisca vitripennis]
MDFNIELTKNGKPFITFKNHKYREAYSIKNGDVIWRCLGRTCGASIKTDANKSSISIVKSTHSGPHPVTMRSFPSPEQQRKTLDGITTPAKEVVSPCTTACASPPRPSVSPATTEDLEAENAQLKNEIFSTNTSESVKPVIGNTETSQETPATLKDCSVHCDPVSTNYERSAEDRELIDSLKTTIQVLEAELECLRSECKLCMCKNSGPWSTYVKKRSLPIYLQNKFLPLDLDNNERKTNKLEKRQSTQNKNKKKKKKKVNTGTGHWQTKKKKDHAPLNVEPKSIEQVPSEIIFSSMLIVGDSHGRHLAGMVQDLIGRGPKVTGVCKPGAGLLDVASSRPSSDDFTVLIAGTNDIANGQRSNIFRHLERVLQDRMGVSLGYSRFVTQR